MSKKITSKEKEPGHTTIIEKDEQIAVFNKDILYYRGAEPEGPEPEEPRQIKGKKTN